MTEYKNNHGNLSTDQFRDLISKLPELRSQNRALVELVRTSPAKVKSILGQYFSWSGIYEHTFNEQIAYLITLLGIHEPIIKACRSETPLKSFMEIFQDGGELDSWYELNADKIDKKHLLWLVIVLQRNILSIMLFHLSIGSLVEQVRQGSDEAFFKAVSVDRSILSTPTFADRLSLAELQNDKQFFIHLRKALKGPSQKHMEAIGDLRYAIVVLRDSGFDQFTDDELIHLFVGNGLYPKHPSAAKNLRKHIHAARKFSTT